MKNYNLISTATKSKLKIPHCIHGPNLLLEDLNETIPEYKRKYVCSAVRSNECKPFVNFDLAKFKEHHYQKRKHFQNRLIQTLKSPKDDRRWCVDCSILVLSTELDQHEGHFIKESLTLKQLRLPTKLISANVEKKEEAQYFFSDESLKVILKTIIRCRFTHVLCIGCPSIHEQLSIRFKKLNIHSFLLDIDSRYLQFYSSKQYLCFNMANNFLFEKEDKYEKNLNQFLASSSKLLIIADPPFGIMIPALADTLTRLKKKINYFKKDDSEFQMKMMLFHLYFYEKRILTVLPELKMMDYKISYSNHKKMKEDGNSIARLFTDIDGKQIVLKGLNDYKYCKQCERWVHSVSVHCVDCKNCCSKDGKPSGHCSVCDKCVRETYVHCFTCEICTRKGECKCGFNSKNKLHDGNEFYCDDEFNYYNDKNEEDGVNEFKNENVEQGDDDAQPNNSEQIQSNGFGSSGDYLNNYQNNRFNGSDHRSGDRRFNPRDRNFNSRERSSNFRGKSFGSPRDSKFGPPRNRSFNSSRDSKFGPPRNRSFNSSSDKRFGSFGDRRSFGNDRRNGFQRDSSFGRDKDGITKDDFNKMFFSKGNKMRSSSSDKRTGFKQSFNKRTKFNDGHFRRSNDSFNKRPFKRFDD